MPVKKKTTKSKTTTTPAPTKAPTKSSPPPVWQAHPLLVAILALIGVALVAGVVYSAQLSTQRTETAIDAAKDSSKPGFIGQPMCRSSKDLTIVYQNDKGQRVTLGHKPVSTSIKESTRYDINTSGDDVKMQIRVKNDKPQNASTKSVKDNFIFSVSQIDSIDGKFVSENYSISESDLNDLVNAKNSKVKQHNVSYTEKSFTINNPGDTRWVGGVWKPDRCGIFQVDIGVKSFENGTGQCAPGGSRIIAAGFVRVTGCTDQEAPPDVLSCAAQNTIVKGKIEYNPVLEVGDTFRHQINLNKAPKGVAGTLNVVGTLPTGLEIVRSSFESSAKAVRNWNCRITGSESNALNRFSCLPSTSEGSDGAASGTFAFDVVVTEAAKTAGKPDGIYRQLANANTTVTHHIGVFDGKSTNPQKSTCASTVRVLSLEPGNPSRPPVTPPSRVTPTPTPTPPPSDLSCPNGFWVSQDLTTIKDEGRDTATGRVRSNRGKYYYDPATDGFTVTIPKFFKAYSLRCFDCDQYDDDDNIDGWLVSFKGSTIKVQTPNNKWDLSINGRDIDSEEYDLTQFNIRADDTIEFDNGGDSHGADICVVPAR